MSAPGHPDAAVPAPVVRRHVDGEQITVTVDHTGDVDMLRELAEAIASSGYSERDFRELGRSPRSVAAGWALDFLLSDPAVRRALIRTYGPYDAEHLSRELDKALEDLPCMEDTEPCGNQAIDADTGLCPEHMQAAAELALARQEGRK